MICYVKNTPTRQTPAQHTVLYVELGGHRAVPQCALRGHRALPHGPHTHHRGRGGLGAASAPHTARHSAPGRRASAFPRPISAPSRAALPALIQSESCGRGDERLLGSARSRRARPPGGGARPGPARQRRRGWG